MCSDQISVGTRSLKMVFGFESPRYIRAHGCEPWLSLVVVTWTAGILEKVTNSKGSSIMTLPIFSHE